MIKKSLFIVLISLFISNPFGAELSSNHPSILDPCNYTLTSGGKPITYLELLKTAAQATLLKYFSANDFSEFDNMVDDLITNKSTTLTPNKFKKLSEYLRFVAIIENPEHYSYKQPKTGSKLIEAKMLEMDIDYAIGRILALALKAKEDYYKETSAQ